MMKKKVFTYLKSSRDSEGLGTLEALMLLCCRAEQPGCMNETDAFIPFVNTLVEFICLFN